MESNGIEKIEKIEYKYLCDSCHYKCSYKCDWVKHLSTRKHKDSVNGMKMECLESNLSKKSSVFFCDCGRSYSTKSNLGKHLKTCQGVSKNKSQNSEEKMDIYDLVKYLMKENNELKTLLVDQTNKIGDVTMEIVKNGTTNNNNSHNTNNTNSHNKAFNLNFFLNETCKNAMNITDFVDSIKLQLTDLMDVGELGYVEGISKIIVKNLNNLDETIRPIHCTDQKRETFYVKDEDQWLKEDEEKKKLKKVIKTVANKNIKLLPQFRERYPEYNNSRHTISDTYDKIVIETMETDTHKDEKILKNISKATTIKQTKV